MRLKNKICHCLGAALCLLVSACGSNASQSESNQQIAFQTVQQGSVLAKPSNPIITPTVYVLRSLTEWTDFWNVFALTMPTSMPTIDFNQNQFIAVVDGTQSTDKHSIAITEVQSSSSGVVVNVIETSPGQNCSVQPWINQPVHVITTSNIPGVWVMGSGM